MSHVQSRSEEFIRAHAKNADQVEAIEEFVEYLKTTSSEDREASQAVQEKVAPEEGFEDIVHEAVEATLDWVGVY